MTRGKRVALSILIWFGVAIIVGIIIPIIIYGVNLRGYDTFHDLIEVKEFFHENADIEIVSEEIQDRKLKSLVPSDSFCCQYKYQGRIYTIYAYQFKDIEESRQYYYNYTGKLSSQFMNTFSCSSNFYFSTNMTSFDNRNAWHIEGGGLIKFNEMYDSLLGALIQK